MKRFASELAINGGMPAFESPLHVGRPNVLHKEKFLERAAEILDDLWLSNNGPRVERFEAKVAEIINVPNCVAVTNATSGLELTIRALGLTGEVIIPSFTFIATAHSLQWQHISPVFCDIDPRTHNIDPDQIESLITPETTGIIAVHIWGRPCNIEALAEIAAKHNLKLVFDASHAFGCSHAHKMIGGFGNAEVFSFHATKFINAFEGGIISTHDNSLAHTLRQMRNYGFTGYDQVATIGINAKLSEICAAMGLTSLESMDEIIAVNQANHSLYGEALSGIDGIDLIRYNPDDANNYQYIVAEIDEVRFGFSRDRLLDILVAENVLARRYFYPCCHRMAPYSDRYSGSTLVHSEALASRTLQLPTGLAVSSEMIHNICSIIKIASEMG